MNGRTIDVAIAGGGLAGGLIALAFHRRRPDLAIALLEAGSVLGGNHRWSWFANDLDEEGAALMGGFPAAGWTSNEVRFPAYRRQLAAGYRSLASADFDAALRRELPPEAIRTDSEVAALSGDGVTLRSGERLAARAVVDCREFAPSSHLAGGWQVFMGRHLRTTTPHGLERPVIMDAAVDQSDGYRFVYVLPLGPEDIFVEDTYYQDAPRIDRPRLARRIDDYCAQNGWSGEEIGSEAGILPVLTGGDAAAHRAALARPGVALAGARGLFTHPLTSYTLPVAVENALAIASRAELGGPALAAFVDRRARDHWERTRFYRRLGRMLFQASPPERRYRVFERFYRLPEPLIERFYAARSTRADRLRILSGKPPVPVHRAIAALLGKGVPLVQGP